MTLDQVRSMLITRAKKYQIYANTTGVTAWCTAHGVSKARVSEFLSGKRNPTSDILDALNLEWRVMRKKR